MKVSLYKLCVLCCDTDGYGEEKTWQLTVTARNEEQARRNCLKALYDRRMIATQFLEVERCK